MNKKRTREQRLTDVGEHPDPRFTMANERTFLAWLRTSLALIAAGLAVAEFLRSSSELTRLAIALPLLVLGALTAFSSFTQWERKERAMRLDEPLPPSMLPRIIAFAVGAIAVLAALLALLAR